MKLLFLIILIEFLLLINITYTLYSQKSEIDHFEYTQELCEPKYWFYIFDNYFLDSNKVKIKCLNIDSIDNYNITNFQYFKSKKDKYYIDFNGSYNAE